MGCLSASWLPPHKGPRFHIPSLSDYSAFSWTNVLGTMHDKEKSDPRRRVSGAALAAVVHGTNMGRMIKHASGGCGKDDWMTYAGVCIVHE